MFKKSELKSNLLLTGIVFLMFFISVTYSVIFAEASEINTEEKVNSEIIANNLTQTIKNEDMVNVTIDAGWGICEVMGSPHIHQLVANVGEKYPSFMWDKQGFIHRQNYELSRYYYFDENHNKITIDQNSIVSRDVTYLYAEWKALDPDNISSIMFKGSQFGHEYFDYKMVYSETSIADQKDYDELFLERENLSGNVDYQLNDNNELEIKCFDKSQALFCTIYLTSNAKSNANLVYWSVNNRIVVSGEVYHDNLFNPSKNLECYAVYDCDIVPSAFTGGQNHNCFDVFYNDIAQSYQQTLDTFNLNLFAGFEFFYRHNADNSLEIWFGDDEQLCQAHYIIYAKGNQDYVFENWACDNNIIPVCDRTYVNLANQAQSGLPLNVISTYKYVEPVQPIVPVVSETAKTNDGLASEACLFLLLFMVSGTICVLTSKNNKGQIIRH